MLYRDGGLAEEKLPRHRSTENIESKNVGGRQPPLVNALGSSRYLRDDLSANNITSVRKIIFLKSSGIR